MKTHQKKMAKRLEDWEERYKDLGDFIDEGIKLGVDIPALTILYKMAETISHKQYKKGRKLERL